MNANKHKNVFALLATLNTRALSFSKSQYLKTTWWTTPGSTLIVEFCGTFQGIELKNK